ncbi:XAC0095 family protein [Xanthomonas arboricola]
MEQSLFGYYLLPENAQLRLLQTRDHLRFLAALVCAKYSADTSNPHKVTVTPDALEFCFELLAEQIEQVLKQIQPP